MSFSRVVKIGDGSTTQFTVNFALGFISRNDVTVRVGDEVDGSGQPLYRTITWLSDSLLQVAGAPAAPGVKVTFDRNTVKDNLLVDFEDGDVLNEENLNTSQKQAIMVAHEALDGKITNLLQNLDFGTYKAINMGAPTNATDGATKGYVDAAVSSLDAIADDIDALGAISDELHELYDNIAVINSVYNNSSNINTVAANVTDINSFFKVYLGSKVSAPATRNDGTALQLGDLYFSTTSNTMRVYTSVGWRDAAAQSLNMTATNFTGNGVQTTFTLPVDPVLAANVLVWVGGIRQKPGVDYTISGTAVTLVSAPANGAAIDTLVIATSSVINAPAEGTTVWPVADRTALKTTPVSRGIVFMDGTTWEWKSGNYSAQVSSDAREGVYVASSLVASTSGAWVRSGGWAVSGKDIRWFGAGSAQSAAVNTAAIQAAVDMRGLVVIPDDGGDYQINNTILVRSNTTVRWTGNSFLKLTAPSTVGAVIVGFYEGPLGSPSGMSYNILFENPLVDGNNQGYPTSAAYGENGIGGAYVDGFRIKGGIVKNCRNGTSAWSGTGGKGIQIENTVSNCKVEGVLVVDCTIGSETGGTAGSEMTNIHYSNLTMLRCDTMITGRHTNSPPVSGVNVNSAVFEDIVGYNCGLSATYWTSRSVNVGAIALDRVNNFDVRNVTLFNDAAYGTIPCVVRQYRGNNCKIGVAFYGDATNLVDSAVPAVGIGLGSTGTRNNNIYEIAHMLGTTGRGVVAAAGDSSNHNNNVYKFKTATVSTELFDANCSQPDLFGFFENAVGDKTIEGPLNVIDSIHARNYPATFNRARVGSLQFNNIYMSFGAGTQLIGTANTDALVLQHNLVEKLRVLSTGVRVALPTYADNAAATSGGLVAGDLYKTATGEVRIRV